MRRPLILLSLAAASALFSFLIPPPDPDALLEREATRMQDRVNDRAVLLERSADQAEGWLDRHAAHERFAEAIPDGVQAWAFHDDSLLAWSSGGAVNEDSLHTMPRGHVRIKGSIYLHAERHDGAHAVHVLAEVWNEPPFRNAYLHPSFHSSLHASFGLIAETGPGIGPVVRDANGGVMCRLAWAEGASPLFISDWIQLLLRVLTIVLIICVCWTGCSRVAAKGKPWTAVLLFLAILVALRYVSILLYPIAPFDRLALFGPELYAASSWLPSLGDLLINAVLLLVVSRFAHIALRKAHVPQGPLLWITSLLFTGALLLLAGWITAAFIGLVEDSSVDLDLFHLQDLTAYSVVALVCVALLFAAWWLMTDAAAVLFTSERRPRSMVIASGAALLISILLNDLFGVVDMILVLWPVPLVIAAVHGRARGHRIVHALFALAIFSFIGAHVLNKYTERRELSDRIALAERSVTSDDPVVELLFRSMAPQLRHDAAVYALLRDSLPCSSSDLEARIRQEYFTGYWERYDVRLYAFGTDGAERCATSTEPARSLRSDAGFTRTVAAVDMPDLFIDARPGERSFYHAQVAVMAADTTPPVQLVIELHPRIAPEGQGFPELLLNDADGRSQRLGRYAYARYENSVLMEHRGFAFPLTWNKPLGVERFTRTTIDGQDLLAYGDAKASLVVLARPAFTWLDRATTFSWLFAFFSVVLALAFVLRALVRGRTVPSPGLGGKVRIALLAFAALGLLFFGLGAQRLLSRSLDERNNEALLEKSRSMQVELRQKLEGVGALTPERGGYLAHLLSGFSNVFFTDINLYAPDGRLLATSRPQVFDAGLLDRRMNAAAYDRLARDGRSQFVHIEQLGSARYRSAYLPLRDKQGVLLGYVNLPSFARQGELDQERGNLLTAIVNLFVLLLALSLLAGVFISGWTTRPLELLKRGLSRIALQGTNEPIAYSGRDEVGDLVRVYNRKVEELRESADKLARGERESAWREMARQVAHEIKNPLTPMKLGIQHFQRTWDANAADAQQKLERFSASMVEQIDALSRVANDFSQFAEMSAATGSVLDVNEVAKNAVELFQGEPDADITLMASTALMVKADREHLLRVFNNLIKNALQAIPEGRRGRITVVLRADGDHAIAEVRDNGAGIPEEARDRIFTPSFTTKSSGMGLGLAMVKRIVEQAGGSVHFGTRIGEGTTFFITLPLHVAGRN